MRRGEQQSNRAKECRELGVRSEELKIHLTFPTLPTLPTLITLPTLMTITTMKRPTTKRPTAKLCLALWFRQLSQLRRK